MAEFLASTDSIVHGTTLATNAILAGNTPKTGLVINEGYEDLLLFGLGSKGKSVEHLFRSHQDYPEPIIPRYLTRGVRGRINAEGDIETDLDVEGVRSAIRELKGQGVAAIAVSFLWSIVNPEHELAVRQIVEQEYPGVHCSLGHEVTSVVREYERTSTCALDASLRPLFASYVEQLSARLRGGGYGGELLMVNSRGGVMGAEELARVPSYTLKSGPSMAPVAGMTIVEAEGQGRDLIICDMGGTSFDASMVVGGEMLSNMMGMVGPYHYCLPALEVNSIGAGGGSIAWVDSGGLTHVGPRSAGSVPGPACYGLGGTEATVTDADVVLGYLSPGQVLAGKLEINAELAAKAIRENVAEPLGKSVEEAASIVYTTVNENMVLGLSEISIQRGIDPRGHMVVAGGGCSPAHVVPITKELGIEEVIVPKLAGGLCAFGMLAADLLYERARSLITRSDDFAFEEVNATLRVLNEEGDRFLSRASVAAQDRVTSFSVMASYPYQSWEIEVAVPWEHITPERLTELVELFREAHQRTYGFVVPNEAVQFVSWRMKAIGIQPKPALVPRDHGERDASRAIKGKRRAYFLEARDFVETTVYAGEKLESGNIVFGPAIVEEPTTTVVLPEDYTLTVTGLGNYHLRPR